MLNDKSLYFGNINRFNLKKSFLLKFWKLATFPIWFIYHGISCLVKYGIQKKIVELKPPGPRGHILLGVLPELNSNSLNFINSLWQTYGCQEGICRYSIFNETAYLVTKPEYCQSIAQDSETFIRGRSIEKKRRILSDSFFTPDGAISKQKRKECMPHPNNNRIDEHHYTVIKEACEKTIIRWNKLIEEEEEREIDVLEEMSKCTSDVLTTFYAGHDATGLLLMWSIYELSRRSEIYVKLNNELNQNVKDDVPTFEEISNLTYLSKVIQEVLRIYPSLPIIVRDVIKDTFLGKYPIRKGSTVLIGVAQIGQDDKRWDNPSEFNPERFNDELIYKVDPYDLNPIGGGLYLGAEQSHGHIEAKVILASLIKKFNFSLKEVVRPIMRGTLHPEKNVQVTLRDNRKHPVGRIPPKRISNY
ncbi:MAG: cytochrome P450 [Parachlamydiaceae bacterium]|nr:cytochrome P450 [Parachlamydiaceae bacterium]